MTSIRYLFILCILAISLHPSTAQDMIGIFSKYQDTLSTSYDDGEQSYQLTALAATRSAQLSRVVEGDFIFTAFFKHDRYAHESARAGLMVKTESTDYTLSIDREGRALDESKSGGGRGSAVAPKFGYSIIQFERQGALLHSRVAIAGEALQHIVSTSIKRNQAVDVGLYLQSADSSVATAWNVRLEKTVPDYYNPSASGHLASRLEIMDVFTGKRKVIHTSDERFEAPNWMPDSTRLLFNEQGSLYTINIDGTEKTRFNTGAADRNNNDHGISFDGTKLAISHHREGRNGGGSSVYVMDLAGGEPQLVTDKTPSYWHGWAPNNEEVVYVAQREQTHYDIYKKNINGGEELRLSDYEGSHADGPEYTPDGEYIYYNACPTGTMQIWRMFPDGWNKEQVTFDEYNDWFPHISPDGKWIAFLSFPTHIDPKSHPAYKRVMLRLMPASGGAPRVIGYLYGGQGTINVPSWSPDSKSIAFVSYSRE